MVDVDKHTRASTGFIDIFETPPTIERFMSIPSTSSSPDTLVEEEEEDLSDYKENGYHPVEIGSIYNDKYQIVRKLGWGHFSTVWLARVVSKGVGRKFVAIKIMRSAPHYTEAAWDEVQVLERAKTADKSHPGYKHVVTIEDTFVHVGPNGKHVCMVFEVLGASLLSLMRRFNQNGIPEPLVKQIAKQVCLGLDYLHRVCGVIHTDLKPENVLIEVPGLEELLDEYSEEDTASAVPNVIKASRPLGNHHTFDTNTEISVKIADLGNGCWANRHFSNDIQTREYRAPEVILGSKWGASVDIWSLACMVFELITGDYLFEPQAGARFSKNDDHIAQIIELLGRFPLSLLIKGQWTQLYFEQNGQLRNIFHLEEWSLSDVFVDKYGYSPESARELCDFLLPMLALNPTLRADAGGMSNHSWLRDAVPSITINRPLQGSGEDIKGWSSISTDLPEPPQLK